jgi:transposase
LSIEQAAELLGVGRGAAYAASREYTETRGASGLPTIAIGRRRRVPTAALLEVLRDPSSLQVAARPPGEDARITRMTPRRQAR